MLTTSSEMELRQILRVATETRIQERDTLDQIKFELNKVQEMLKSSEREKDKLQSEKEIIKNEIQNTYREKVLDLQKQVEQFKTSQEQLSFENQKLLSENIRLKEIESKHNQLYQLLHSDYESQQSNNPDMKQMIDLLNKRQADKHATIINQYGMICNDLETQSLRNLQVWKCKYFKVRNDNKTLQSKIKLYQELEKAVGNIIKKNKKLSQDHQKMKVEKVILEQQLNSLKQKLTKTQQEKNLLKNQIHIHTTTVLQNLADSENQLNSPDVSFTDSQLFDQKQNSEMLTERTLDTNEKRMLQEKINNFMEKMKEQTVKQKSQITLLKSQRDQLKAQLELCTQVSQFMTSPRRVQSKQMTEQK